MQSHCMNRKEYSEKRKSSDRLLCLPKIPSKSCSNLSCCVYFIIIVSLKYISFDILLGLASSFESLIVFFSEKWRNTVQNMQQYFSRYFLKDKLETGVCYFYRTRVRSLMMLVSTSLTHSLPFSKLESDHCLPLSLTH